MMSKITGEQVLAERKRRKMSRTKFAELVGLTPTKVGNIEKGRDIKPEELELLQPHVLVEFQEGNVTQLPADDPEPPAQTSNGAADQQPVVLVTEEELEEAEDDGEEVVTPGSGLPTRVPFTLPGYHVTNSELRTFKRCRRKWYLAYYREMRLREQPLIGPRSVGTRLHLALAAYYSSRHEDPMTVLREVIEEDKRLLQSREMTAQEDVDAFEKEAELSRIMIEGYLEWVKESGVDEGLEVIGDEMIVEAPFDAIPGVVLAGKLDLRMRRQLDGARFFLDHKSTGSLTAPLKTLHLDEQMIHYHLLEFLDYLKAGQDAGTAAQEVSHGGLYNMLKKVKRTARANPPFFDRVEVRHNIHELREYYLRVFGEITDILEVRRKLDEGMDHRQVAYLNPTNDCSWDCDFLPICPMFNDGSAAEEALANLYEKTDPHDHYHPYGERENERTN